MIGFKYIQKADQLPMVWDQLADNYFQQVSFLLHTETYNNCQQRYYLCSENDKVIACAIVYTLRMDLLTYLKIKSPLKMHIIGIPCSVSASGIFGDNEAIEQLKEHIFKKEKGFLLILNMKDKPITGCDAIGSTLPTIVLANHFDTWDDYCISLRANYRRRLKQIRLADPDLVFEKKPCLEFTEGMYRLYLEVYKRSSGKLEKLTCDFFRRLPSGFILTVCSKNGVVIGWNIALSHQNTYYFFLGGVDYHYNSTSMTYFRLLELIIHDGIEQKLTLIELGQTAEIPKLRMGGSPVPLFMQAHHSNRMINRLLMFSGKLLEYKRVLENAHPLKKVNR